MTVDEGRRRLLKLGGAAALGVSLGRWLAGCSAEDAPDDDLLRRRPVPDPLGVAVSRWAADPFARGIGSVVVPGADPSARALLGRPIADRVLLASEATSGDRPGTAAGAWDAGVLAARRVLRAHGDAATVVVVGGGLTGVAATRTLSDAGAVVTTLEATDRIGGHARTVRLDGAAVDLGWSAVATGSALADVAAQLELATTAIPAGLDLFSRDRGLFPAYQQRNVLAHRDALIGRAIRLDLDPTQEGESFGRALRGADPDWDRDPSLRWAIDDAVTAQRGATPDQVAHAAWREGVGGSTVVLRRGLAQLAEIQAQDTDLRTDHVVRRIRRSADGVRVETLAERFDADAVIVAVPLGVLQGGVITFEPALPTVTRQALASLRPALVDRVALRFRDRFWGAAGHLGWVGGRTGHFTSWTDATTTVGRPVLVATLAGEVARAQERRTDRQLVADALAALRGMYEP